MDSNHVSFWSWLNNVPPPTPAESPGDPHGVTLEGEPVAARALRTALDRAWTSLQDPGCQRVLVAFSDRTGRSLEARLAAFGIGVQEHLTRIVFIDNTREQRCETGVLAFTEPGTYVVRLCVGEFKRTWQQDPQHASAALIHEMLHTLGLGENPPASGLITDTIASYCGG